MTISALLLINQVYTEIKGGVSESFRFGIESRVCKEMHGALLDGQLRSAFHAIPNSKKINNKVGYL